jgi:hypothetical protein
MKSNVIVVEENRILKEKSKVNSSCEGGGIGDSGVRGAIRSLGSTVRTRISKDGNIPSLPKAVEKIVEDRSWINVSRARTAGDKRVLASVVQEELGRIDRNKRVVISGLAFVNDTTDEQVVKDFFDQYKVKAPFSIFKRVRDKNKDKVVPLVTKIIVLDVGSVGARDSILRAVKPQLRADNLKIYLTEDKSSEDLREEFKLREEARLLMKNLPANDLGKIRYGVRNKKIYNLGPILAPNTASSSLGLGLGLSNSM